MLRKQCFPREKNWSQKHPKTCKRLPTSSKCRNALFLIIFSRRFTHVSLGSSHAHVYFGWASTWICMGPDLEIIWEVKKSKKNRFFHYYSTNWFEKASHIIYITFLPKIHQFYPNWSPVWGMHSEFWLCFAYAVLEKTPFSQNKNATKPVFHSRIS